MAKSNGNTDDTTQAADGDPAADPAPADDGAPKAAAFKSADDIKAWVRKEIALAREGHSEETRAANNP